MFSSHEGDETSRMSAFDLYEDLLVKENQDGNRLLTMEEVVLKNQSLTDQNKLLMQQLVEKTQQAQTYLEEKAKLDRNFKELLATAKVEIERKNRLLSHYMNGPQISAPMTNPTSSTRSMNKTSQKPQKKQSVSLKGRRIDDEELRSRRFKKTQHQEAAVAEDEETKKEENWEKILRCNEKMRGISPQFSVECIETNRVNAEDAKNSDDVNRQKRNLRVTRLSCQLREHNSNEKADFRNRRSKSRETSKTEKPQSVGNSPRKQISPRKNGMRRDRRKEKTFDLRDKLGQKNVASTVMSQSANVNKQVSKSADSGVSAEAQIMTSQAIVGNTKPPVDRNSQKEREEGKKSIKQNSSEKAKPIINETSSDVQKKDSLIAVNDSDYLVIDCEEELDYDESSLLKCDVITPHDVTIHTTNLKDVKSAAKINNHRSNKDENKASRKKEKDDGKSDLRQECLKKKGKSMETARKRTRKRTEDEEKPLKRKRSKSGKGMNPETDVVNIEASCGKPVSSTNGKYSRSKTSKVKNANEKLDRMGVKPSAANLHERLLELEVKEILECVEDPINNETTWNERPGFPVAANVFRTPVKIPMVVNDKSPGKSVATAMMDVAMEVVVETSPITEQQTSNSCKGKKLVETCMKLDAKLKEDERRKSKQNIVENLTQKSIEVGEKKETLGEIGTDKDLLKPSPELNRWLSSAKKRKKGKHVSGNHSDSVSMTILPDHKHLTGEQLSAEDVDANRSLIENHLSNEIADVVCEQDVGNKISVGESGSILSSSKDENTKKGNPESVRNVNYSLKHEVSSSILGAEPIMHETMQDNNLLMRDDTSSMRNKAPDGSNDSNFMKNHPGTENTDQTSSCISFIPQNDGIPLVRKPGSCEFKVHLMKRGDDETINVNQSEIEPVEKATRKENIRTEFANESNLVENEGIEPHGSVESHGILTSSEKIRKSNEYEVKIQNATQTTNSNNSYGYHSDLFPRTNGLRKLNDAMRCYKNAALQCLIHIARCGRAKGNNNPLDLSLKKSHNCVTPDVSKEQCSSIVKNLFQNRSSISVNESQKSSTIRNVSKNPKKKGSDKGVSEIQNSSAMDVGRILENSGRRKDSYREPVSMVEVNRFEDEPRLAEDPIMNGYRGNQDDSKRNGLKSSSGDQKEDARSQKLGNKSKELKDSGLKQPGKAHSSGENSKYRKRDDVEDKSKRKSMNKSLKSSETSVNQQQRKATSPIEQSKYKSTQQKGTKSCIRQNGVGRDDGISDSSNGCPEIITREKEEVKIRCQQGRGMERNRKRQRRNHEKSFSNDEGFSKQETKNPRRVDGRRSYDARRHQGNERLQDVNKYDSKLSSRDISEVPKQRRVTPQRVAMHDTEMTSPGKQSNTNKTSPALSRTVWMTSLKDCQERRKKRARWSSEVSEGIVSPQEEIESKILDSQLHSNNNMLQPPDGSREHTSLRQVGDGNPLGGEESKSKDAKLLPVSDYLHELSESSWQLSQSSWQLSEESRCRFNSFAKVVQVLSPLKPSPLKPCVIMERKDPQKKNVCRKVLQSPWK